jgi:pimeloyl-ACP methyl ester carboxylesterase
MINIYKNDAGKEQVLHSYDRILEMWSTDFQEHDVETAYGMTHCITSGIKENPPLLLFHGVGDNSAVMWALNMQELSKHFYCIAVDTIGGPGKSVPNENFTKNTFNQVEWINQIIDHFKIETINIAGVSNGAYMAYNYTSTNSERVNKVVCMEGGMVIKPIKTMIQTLLIMFPEILVPTRHNLFRVIKKLSSPNSEVFDKYPLLAEHLILLMKNHNQRAMFVHKIQKYEREKNAITMNKLYFLIAEHRINLKKDFIAALDAGGFHYSVIPNAGHGINHEQPEIINNKIFQFMLK